MACSIESQVNEEEYCKKNHYFIFNFYILKISIHCCSIPFERSSVYGYLYYSCISAVCAFHYFGLLTVYVQFFLGMCFYLNAFCQDFAISIRKIEKWRDQNVENTATQPIAPRDLIESECALKKQICEIVDFQAEII